MMRTHAVLKKTDTMGAMGGWLMALNWAAGPPPESGRRRPRSAAASMRAFLTSASPHLGAAHACANPSRLLRRLGLDLVAPADRSRHRVRRRWAVGKSTPSRLVFLLGLVFRGKEVDLVSDLSRSNGYSVPMGPKHNVMGM